MPFMDGQWYDLRVEPGTRFDESNKKSTPFIHVPFVVTSPGEMAGMTIGLDIWVTDNNKERAAETLAILGFNPEKDDFGNIDQILTGHECAAQMKKDAPFKDKPGDFKIDRVKPKGVGGKPGGVMMKIANLFGNKATKAPPEPDKEEFEGQF